ncbi:MAG TPA: tRNA-guanine transglycosylase [Methanofastidiosum sp.]|nr:tRNA-guanine transglycosylase [Methanofastidiosum sp.]HPA49127.1 tRNA-guanine transglycosylase [Methanofastidiosum sp.]HQK62753.1 tRNA-guanine transglycosylase [Methanofastidiosum sp.]HQQ48916.1 tRNA-guanine transglycosylase [Methanofastidiosum sp.]
MESIPRIKTSNGDIRTPALLPVCALTYGVWDVFIEEKVIPPWKLSEATMFSLEYVRNTKYEEKVINGFHKLFSDNKPIFVDSGGFQSMKKGIERDPIDVLRFQEKLKADIAATFDYPVPLKVERTEYMKMLQKSIDSANLSLENRKRKKMLLYSCVHGFSEEEIEWYFSKLDYGFDGYAMGSLVPRKNDYKTLIELISKAKSLSSERGKPLHIFGVTGFPMLYALSYMGIETMDSWTYLVASVYKEYIHPETLKRVKMRKTGHIPSCDCFICKDHNINDFLGGTSVPQAYLAIHNLNIFMKEMNLINEHLKDNSFDQLVELKSKNNQRIKKAYEHVKKYVNKE